MHEAKLNGTPSLSSQGQPGLIQANSFLTSDNRNQSVHPTPNPEDPYAQKVYAKVPIENTRRPIEMPEYNVYEMKKDDPVKEVSFWKSLGGIFTY